MNESVSANPDIDGDENVVRHRRQRFVEIAVPIHEQDLQGQRERSRASQFLTAAEAGVEEPDQPAELDRREDNRTIDAVCGS